jgi:hypothetical protein
MDGMKMKTLDDAVIELNGVLPEFNRTSHKAGMLYIDIDGALLESVGKGWGGNVICTLEQFQRRAKELGFVGRYRWGVEYKTNGKRPELADDVEIKWQAVAVNEWWPKHCDTTAGELDWNGKYAVCSFKITDQRYKPADTSYLDKPESSTDNESEWYDYDNQKALRLPPVGTECIYLNAASGSNEKAFIVGSDFFDKSAVIWRNSKDGGQLYYGYKHDLKPLDHDRKAKDKAEKDRTRLAIYNKWLETGDIDDVAKLLWSLGFRVPE